METLETYLKHLETCEADVRGYSRAKEVYINQWGAATVGRLKQREAETVERLKKHNAWLVVYNEGLEVTTLELERRRADAQRLEKLVAAKRAATAGPPANAGASAASGPAAAGASAASGPAGGVI